MNSIFLGVAAAALIAITATPSFAQRERGWQGEITGDNGGTVFIDRDVSAGGGQRFGTTAITGPGGGTTTIDHVGMHGGGAGHGSTFPDPWGNFWHVATGLNWIKYKFERRLVLFPAGFDPGGQLYCNTAFGDYPQFLPTGPRDHLQSTFTGWMMLSYRKSCQSSSALPGKNAELAFDENIRTYWSAASADPGEFLSVDLGRVCAVYAFQVNYADEDAHLYDKQFDIYHQYRVLYSHDGENWKLMVDKSENKTDVPHDYVEMERPVKARYLKLVNVHMAEGKFAVAGFRVFGLSGDPAPDPVKDFRVQRGADTREADFSWAASPGAYAYQLRYGIAPDKLYNAIMVYDSARYHFRGLNRDVAYFCTIEALGEGGVSGRGEVVGF